MTKTILVVDDDDLLRNTLAKGLRANDFMVVTAESAEEALKLMERLQLDAIVLDRMLGNMDGLSLLKKVRENNNLTPIIMLTALSGPENTIEGLSNGANDYLTKPFQFQELILRLNNIMKFNVKKKTKKDLPKGLLCIEDNYFIKKNDISVPILLNLSHEEKKLLRQLLTPIGNIATAAPMVVKRLRNKLNTVSLGVDIITIRGSGYKLVQTQNGD